MKRILPRLVAAVSVVVLALVPAAVRADTGSAPGNPASSCFWLPTFSATDQQLNYAYPDTGAHYWAAQFTLPAGARLQLHGRFAHARYQSLNSYNIATSGPTFALNDVHTVPDPGSRNPYLPGADRAGDDGRSYTVAVRDQPAPASPEPNTVYAGVAGQTRVVLVYRLYLPDRDRDVTGGVGLPAPRLRLADGTVLSGQQLCTAVSAARTIPSVRTLPLREYELLRGFPGLPATYPAAPTPVWHTFYNTQLTLECTYLPWCVGPAEHTGGQYSNIDNQYTSASINRGFGPLLVLTGVLPRTPATLAGQPVMNGDVDLRYWSLCDNESVATTRVVGCLYDEQIPTDAAGRYTIVASLPQDRPANATAACGVAWLPLSATGDGAGHPDDGYLIMRNMLPSPGFTHAVQDTRTPGDESVVLGPYLPEGVYTSRAAFEDRACHLAGR